MPIQLKVFQDAPSVYASKPSFISHGPEFSAGVWRKELLALSLGNGNGEAKWSDLQVVGQ